MGFDPRAAAGDFRVLEMIVNQHQQIFSDLVVGIAERDVFAARDFIGVRREGRSRANRY